MVFGPNVIAWLLCSEQSPVYPGNMSAGKKSMAHQVSPQEAKEQMNYLMSIDGILMG